MQNNLYYLSVKSRFHVLPTFFLNININTTKGSYVNVKLISVKNLHYLAQPQQYRYRYAIFCIDIVSFFTYAHKNNEKETKLGRINNNMKWTASDSKQNSLHAS